MQNNTTVVNKTLKHRQIFMIFVYTLSWANTWLLFTVYIIIKYLKRQKQFCKGQLVFQSKTETQFQKKFYIYNIFLLQIYSLYIYIYIYKMGWTKKNIYI